MSTWHVDDELWAAYRAGRLDQVTADSMDAHVQSCSRCHASARALAPVADAIWAGVRDRIEAPRLSLSARLLRGVGVRRDDLVVLSIADTLLLPWVTAIASAVAVALVTGFAGIPERFSFLLLAPLVPVSAVVVAYDVLDPLLDVTAPTPYSKVRLALLRGTAALAVALPATGLLGLLVPGVSAVAFLWLLPALALTIVTLVAMTWLDPVLSGVAVAAGWCAVVGLAQGATRLDMLTGPAGQAVFAMSAAAAAALFVARTNTLRLQGGLR